MLLDQPDERLDEPRTPAAGDGRPDALLGDRQHAGGERRSGRVGTEPGMQHPRREQAAYLLGAERAAEPVAGGLEHAGGEFEQAARAEPPPGAEREERARERAEVALGQLARDALALTGGIQERPPRIAVAGAVALELRGRLLRAAQQERGAPVGEDAGRGKLGVEILEPVSGELRGELGVCLAAEPGRVPAAEDVVQVARQGELGRLDRPAEGVAALEHEHAPAGPCEQCRAGQRVDAAPDDDGVVGRPHARAHRRALRRGGAAGRGPLRALPGRREVAPGVA